MSDLTASAAPATFEGRVLPNPSEPPYDQGLQFDVETLLDRRSLLKLFGYGAMGLGVSALAGCTPGATVFGTLQPTAAASPGGSSPAGASSAAACAQIPEETEGPFPGDGSNGPNVISQSGVVRPDIRSSFGGSSTVAAGVPLSVRLALQDLARSCAPLANAAVYLWQCDQQGRYSLYSQGATNENYLRGVHAAGSDGIVTFLTIFPACYPGRWPHIHFEVYPSLATATSARNKIATSQVALPEDISRTVYAQPGYEQSVSTLNGVSLDRDGVFREDRGARQLGTMSGSVASGLTVFLPVPVRAA